MYKIAYLGCWESVPELVAAICEHDTFKLDALIKDGLD